MSLFYKISLGLLMIALCSGVHARSEAELVQQGLDYINKRELEKAFNILKPLAEAGNIAAQHRLGTLYLTKPPERNKYFNWDKGVYWYTKAIDQGNAAAQFGLAIAIFRHPKFKGDTKAALRARFKLHKKAAHRGHALAQTELGQMYMSGGITDRDVVTAYMWFELSNYRFDTGSDSWAQFGNLYQETLIKDKDINGRQIDQAIKRAQQWEKDHPDAYKSWPIPIS